MTTDLRTAAQQALAALEAGDWYIGQLEVLVYAEDDTDTHRDRAEVQAAIDALRAAIESSERQQTHSEECWKWHHECAVAKIEQLQTGIETLHAMYEQACQQRDYLMDQQRAQIEAMRGRVQ